MRLLVDMNLSPRWVEFFAAHGIEADHWSALGASRAPDREIFAHARQHGHVIFSHDLDFSAILAQTAASKPSVIQVRHPRPRPEEFGPQVVRAVADHAEALANGALLLIEPGRHRIRILPIGREPTS